MVVLVPPLFFKAFQEKEESLPADEKSTRFIAPREKEPPGDDKNDSEDIKTKSTSWSHLSSKNKQEIAQFEPLVKDLVQKIRLASASASVGGAGGDGEKTMDGGSDFRLEAAREFSSKAIEVFREIEKELDEEMVRSVSLATEDDDFGADDELSLIHI